MHLVKLDPRALKENPDTIRRSKSSPQADALLLATIKAVGVIQPPVVTPEPDGGNGYVIDAGHRRVRLAIAAGLNEIEVLVTEAANDNGAMRSMVENSAREALNPVDQWRGIERLVALDWTEEAIAIALALPVRQIRKLRLLANVLPAMLDQMAKGDMPNEQQLRTIAAVTLDEQKAVWKANKPKKGDTVTWWTIANGLTKTRMLARDASFGDDLAVAYGIEWIEDLFAPADEDSRYTTNMEAYLGAQQEWMTNSLPKGGVITELDNWSRAQLPPKAEQIYGKPSRSDRTAMYLDRNGKVQTVHFRMPEVRKAKGADGGSNDGTADETLDVPKQRPDVTQTGMDIIGDFRTDALHDALGRVPIEDDMLMALLVLAFTATNVRVDSGAESGIFGAKRFTRHAVRLFDQEGHLAFDRDTLRAVARSVLVEVLSCRRNASNSGTVARIAGDAIGADEFLPNMGTQDFLSCLSRPALETSCAEASIQPRPKVRETRAALVEHFRDGHLVHPSACFAPDSAELFDWIASGAAAIPDDEPDDEPGADDRDVDADDGGIEDMPAGDPDDQPGADLVDPAAAQSGEDNETAYGIAAE